ncbi:MAG: (2Fe-2S) ferredoxin domain-containing protein [Atribacterota bacterium]
MVTISICVGSSCHLKGAYDIIHQCESLIEEFGLKSQVELRGTFCLGRCTEEGVTVVVDGEVLSGVSPKNFREIFVEKVLSRLKEESSGGH